MPIRTDPLLEHWNRRLRQPEAMLFVAPVFWASLWLTLGIWMRATTDQVPVLPAARCLWLALPLSGFLEIGIRACRANGIRLSPFWPLPAILVIMANLVAIWLLGDWSGMGITLLVLVAVHTISYVVSHLAEGPQLPSDEIVDTCPENPAGTRPEEHQSHQQEWQEQANWSEDDRDLEWEEGNDEGDDEWNQRLTRRRIPAPDSQPQKTLEQLEWFGKSYWSDNRRQAEWHVLFQPPFLSPPEVQVELAQGTGSVRVAEVFSHGVRLEWKHDASEVPDSENFIMVWLTAQGPVDEGESA